MTPLSATTADDNTRHPYDQILVDITSYVFNYEICSPKAFERAKIALLDALGCAFETLKQSPEARLVIGPVVPGTQVPNGFRLPGTSHELDPMKGAFDLGSLIRYLDHNDAFPGAEWGHPSDNIGAILAVADYIDRTARTTSSPALTMRAVLLALIKAYEIQGCFQIRNAFNKVGLDHTILVRIASTAVVCYLLNCTEQQTLSALSHSFIDAGPLRIYRQSPNTGPRKGWAAGDACMRAVHLALLAKKGQPGAPTVLSNPKWGLYTTLMQGREFQLPKPFGTNVIETVFFKIHAAEGHAASAVEAALILSRQLRARHPPLNVGIEEAVSRVRVRTQKPAMIIINKQGALHNAADRDHCMQYMIAVVLLKGSMITSADYDDDSSWATDPRVDKLRAKIDMIEDEQMTADYHDPQKRSGANALLMTLTGEEVLEEVLVEYPTGHPWRDDTPGLVKEKFEENVRGLFGAERSSDIVKLAEMGLEEFIEMDVSRFVDTVAGPVEVESLDMIPSGDEEKKDSAGSIGRRIRCADARDDDETTEAFSTDKVDGSNPTNIDEATKAASSIGQVELLLADSPTALKRGKNELPTAGTTASEKEEPAALIIDQSEPTATAVAAATTPVLESPASAKKPLDTRENIRTASAKTYSHQFVDGVREREKAISAVDGIPYHDASHDQCEERKHPDDPPSGEIFVEAFPPGKTPHPSPYISYNIPYAEACAKHIDDTFHATRVYILASGTLSKKTDDLPSLRHAINKRLGEDSVVGIRRGVKPHTYYSDILQIVQEAKDANTNCLVTLGGGSLTDAAKVVALALANNATTLDELETLYFDSPTLRNPLLPATVPIICIPTSLSAGEYTPLAGATNDITHHKHSFQHPTVGPRLIILSPQLTTTTPLHIWLSTGIRAVDHCVESICSIKASAEGDAIAEKGLRRLLPGLLTTKMNPGDLASRLACQLGAIDAISAPLNRVPMGASHGIGHQLGPLGVGHGETSCVLLPAVCKYNKRVNAEQQRRVLDILWSEEAVTSVLRSAGVEREKSDLGDALDALFRALGMPRTLDEVGIARDQFESLAVGSLDDRWCKTNPIPLTREEQVLEILEMCVKER